VLHRATSPAVSSSPRECCSVILRQVKVLRLYVRGLGIRPNPDPKDIIRRLSTQYSVLSTGGFPHYHFSLADPDLLPSASVSELLRVRTGPRPRSMSPDRHRHSRGDRDVLSHSRRDAIRVVGVKREEARSLR
jgi:hypothetical protein